MNFYIDKIDFSEKQAEILGVSQSVRNLHRLGNFVLSPVRYLCNGHSVQLLGNHEFFFGKPQQPNKKGVAGLLRGVVSVLLFLPCGLVGYLLKRASFVLASNYSLQYCYERYNTGKVKDDTLVSEF